MNKLTLTFCALTLLSISSCTKKEEATTDTPAYSNYKVVGVQNSGSISGRVLMTDSSVYVKQVTIQRDQHVCGASHRNPSDPGTNGVKGCVVWLEGITEGKAFAESASPKLEQRVCEFLPHVQIVKAGTTILVTNEDDALHNYHVTLGNQTVTNEAQPAGAPPHELTLTKTGLHKVMCDVHPWMNAMIMVPQHPYYTITDSTGAFSLRDVPPGTYKLKLWRDDWRIEELKNEEGRIVSYKWKPDFEKDAQVTVTAGQDAVTEFSLP